MSGDTFTHPHSVSDVADIDGNARGTLALSTTAAETAVLPEGRYDIWCDVNVSIAIGTAPATGLTAGNGYLLRANVTVPFVVRRNRKIAGILSSGTGTLEYFKIG